ncbi:MULTISPECIES: hypothetical protein [unclassified Bradyrhizobium]|uniref:hypothetical protein n=1 Tax=unclassified Bradyrhizobium TaxID=2631580 RepID=UPI0024E0F7D7|nr:MULTISPECIES: hypothetical protein [unclassified Bradyrhizobium]
MTRMMALVATVVLGTTAAFAHQDSILSLGTDGTIPGLPPAYQTTRLHLVFSEGSAGVVQELSFLSSGRETRVQPCLLRLIAKASLRPLYVTGSWYHDETIMPHYVQIEFRDPPSSRQTPAQTSVRFLFSLRDSVLLEVTRLIAMPLSAQNPEDAAHGSEGGHATIQFQPVHLLNGCPDPSLQ